jgi:cytochrome c peroxidase
MPRSKLLFVLFAVLGVLVFSATVYVLWPRPDVWTEAEVATLRTLWLDSLPPLPPDPSNQYAEDSRAVALGEKLFFDGRFSANGLVSCGTCHLPHLGFQDGRALGQGVGITDRRTMPIAGMAYSPWLFWDGRKDSLWSQALGPWESPVEHGGTRTQYAHLIAAHYRAEYEALFGPLPDLTGLPPSAGPVAAPEASAAWAALTPADRDMVNQIYANMGKAIAAFERTIMPGPTRFDAYVAAVLAEDAQAMDEAFTDDEVAGLRLFIGEGNCVRCHNGPLLTDNDFHNTAVPAVPGLPEDLGRATGATQVLADEFNCLGPYSDARPEQCAELRFIVSEGEQLVRAYKPPSLRGVAERPPYMHAGQIATLAETLIHYNNAPAAPAGHSELEPLNLSADELAQLLAFLQTLSE